MRFTVGLGKSYQDTDPPYPFALLRARRERPRDRRATEQHDDVAPPHSITASASESSVDGTVRPSALAVFRLMIR